jgi:LacI family transcriptional regulator
MTGNRKSRTGGKGKAFSGARAKPNTGGSVAENAGSHRVSASLADVAKRANASQATVSRVLGGSQHPVSEATRARVLKAAEEVEYTADPIARALVTKMTNTIGVIVGDITESYFAEIARGAEATAGALGHLTIVCNADRNPGAEVAYFRMLQRHHAAGIMFTGGSYPNVPETQMLIRAVAEASRSRTRIICTADRGFDLVPVISVDNRAVLYDMTQHLITLGHARIVFIEGPEGLSTSQQRREGFEQAMREAGLNASQRVSGGFGFEAGRVVATAMLTRRLPDAIIAAGDETAIGVLITLRHAGIQIPRQVSVVGVDDTKYSQLMDLTTVHLPTYELGALAARRILDRGGPAQPMRTILPHRIVQRGSSSWAPRRIAAHRAEPAEQEDSVARGPPSAGDHRG